MAAITVIIHTRNEEHNIKACIISAKLLSKDIIVIDMESTDNTLTMVKKMGVKTHTFPFSRYVEPARSFGIKKAQGEWVFIVDADERVTPALAQEINQLLPQSSHSYFKVPRKNIFAGKKWLRHGGWWPDYQIRLIKKSAFQDWPQRIHSTPHIQGTIGLLREALEHYFHPSLEQMVEKTTTFEAIEADLLDKAKRRVSVLICMKKYLGELYRRLIKNKGFLDGPYGIIESFYQAYSKTITWLLLLERYKEIP